jgi:hypothetical protein
VAGERVERNKPAERLKLLRIHNKPRMLGEFVVEGAAAGVGGLGSPVDAAAGLLCGGGIHGLDERGGDALAAMLGGDEHVLQVAHVIEPRGAAVKQVMHKADELLAFGGLQAAKSVGWRGMVFTMLLIALCADSMPGRG